MTAVRRTSSLAIVSLVAGLLGWTLAPWLGSIIAVITGQRAAAVSYQESQWDVATTGSPKRAASASSGLTNSAVLPGKVS